MTMADTIAVMNEGRIEQLGSAVELYERPRTAFVANFLGSSNLLEGAPPGSGAGGELTLVDGTVLRLPADAPAMGAGTRAGTLAGVRPEKIDLLPADAAPPPGANVLRGTVGVAGFLGVSLHYVVATEAFGDLTVIVPNRGGETLGPGREVLLAWRPEDTFVVES